MQPALRQHVNGRHHGHQRRRAAAARLNVTTISPPASVANQTELWAQRCRLVSQA
ncbi:MAG: hypothetical protein IPG51_04735 [Chloroflexi bacterium]|nr:hypothetical protein [Chloroflexota bacterium]